MRIRCPHCHHALEIVADTSHESVKCPSCGSNLPGLEETLEPRRREAVKSVGHFELLERVGRGHFGDVFRARDTNLDRTVAVKLPRVDRIDDSTLRLFLHEARAAAQLRHPHIVRVYDVDRDGELVYIVSDFIRGVTLADRLESQRLEPRAAAELLATVAEALHYAHEAGVVHRDLKPSNIMLDDAGEPHVMDFGLAKQNSSEISLTTSGDILGTPAYMSPEQARGDSRHADRRSDVYSLGVVLYQMISGEHPFAADTGTLLRRVASDEPAPSRRISEKLPRDLATICIKAMEKDPARRYGTAQDLADDLRRYLRGDPIRARRAGLFERSWRWMRRNPAVTLTSAAALVAFVAMLAALTRGGIGGQNKLGAVAPFRRTISLTTEPPGATLVFFPIDEKTGEPRPLDKIQAKSVSPVKMELSPGDYLIVAYFDDQRFHEVYRRVPGEDPGLPDIHRQYKWSLNAEGVAELRPIKIFDQSEFKGMAKFAGQPKFVMGSLQIQTAPPHVRRVPAFYLDPTELTVGDYLASKLNMPPYYKGNIPPANHALAYFSYDDAVNFAETIGKRIPSESEYEVAATNAGTTAFPWGDDPAVATPWSFGPVAEPRSAAMGGNVPVYGLYSNVAEWTCSWPLPYPALRAANVPEPELARLKRVVRGGPPGTELKNPDAAKVGFGPRQRVIYPKQTWEPGLGFRGARSAKPRLNPEDFEIEIGR